jgi:secreted trypsin-like serine protease
MTVSGWGVTESGNRSNVLLKAVLPVLTADECNTLLKHKVAARYLSPITPDQFCAGGDQADSDWGDSGGPLQSLTQLNSMTFRYVQYGIVSFSYKPTSDDEIVPTIFTRVSSYMSWILDNLAK